jgi:hypothetical protein
MSGVAQTPVRYAVVVAFVLAGCRVAAEAAGKVAESPINEATRPKVDAYCASALAHVKECDPRFPDRTALCSYAGEEGQCQPYINATQSQCLRESSCEAVRAALDKRDWLCGLSLAVPIARE